MLTGIDREETFGYSANSDTGDPKTIFRIGNLTNREKIALVGEVMDAQGQVDVKKIQEKAIDIFLAGVKGVENWVSKKGADPVTIKKVDEKFVDTIPFLVVCEVAGKVIEFNFVGDDERKN